MGLSYGSAIPLAGKQSHILIYISTFSCSMQYHSPHPKYTNDLRAYQEVDKETDTWQKSWPLALGFASQDTSSPYHSANSILAAVLLMQLLTLHPKKLAVMVHALYPCHSTGRPRWRSWVLALAWPADGTFFYLSSL